MEKNFQKCSTCDKYHFTDQQCQPQFKVFHEDYLGDEHKLVRANDAEGAALAYASYYNTRNDYCLMNEEVEVFVEENGKKIKFVISAQPDVYYTATKS